MFVGKLKGTVVPYFGRVDSGKAFFNFLEEEGYVEFLEAKVDFLVYQTYKAFIYEYEWIQDSSQPCLHRVGSPGRILVDLNYRALGYPTITKWLK